MGADDIRNDYFEGLCAVIGSDRFSEEVSYRKLLEHLHHVEFQWTRELDADRADWGLDMRYRFVQAQGYEDGELDVRKYLSGPCSVFEMMVALAVRCEEDMMEDPEYGDRTSQWFWNMIVSLGLGSMNDNNFDAQRVDEVIARFLDREYESSGRGGLFTLKHAPFDAREVDIWCQLCWYLDEVIGDVHCRPTDPYFHNTRERSTQM